jgi:hypothetical protein
MTIVGRLTAYCKGLPRSFKTVQGRKEGDYVALFEEEGQKSIHSWVTKTKSGLKNTMAMTTTVPILGKTWDDVRKPAVFNRFDNVREGCASLDQATMSKAIYIKSRQWPMSILAYLLDTAMVNARTIGLIQKVIHATVFGAFQSHNTKHGIDNHFSFSFAKKNKFRSRKGIFYLKLLE